jgi:hypothetical protein
MFEFDARVWCCEVPVGLSVGGIAIMFPGGDFGLNALSMRQRSL